MGLNCIRITLSGPPVKKIGFIILIAKQQKTTNYAVYKKKSLLKIHILNNIEHKLNIFC